MQNFVIDILFWFHVIIVIAWFGLFAIPLSVWSGRIAFHFWYILTLYASQIVMGLLLLPWSKKYKQACPLTIFMQLLRGYKISDPQTYNHGFIRELGQRIGVKLRPWIVEVLLLIPFIIVTYQYLSIYIF